MLIFHPGKNIREKFRYVPRSSEYQPLKVCMKSDEIGYRTPYPLGLDLPNKHAQLIRAISFRHDEMQDRVAELHRWRDGARLARISSLESHAGRPLGAKIVFFAWGTLGAHVQNC